MGEPRLRAIVVDDEAPARSILREFLSAHPEVEVAAECANGFEAVKAIGELSPDLVFLDVQMPKLDGFEVLELIDARPAVIFCTAHDEFALRAFEVHAVDYLLKPFGRERLAEAITRARARLATRRSAGGAVSGRESGARAEVAGAGGDAAEGGAAESSAAERSAAGARTRGPEVSPSRLAAAARGPGRRLERVVVKDGSRVHVIPIDQLDSAEAADDYVSLRAGGKTYLKHQTLADLEEMLDPRRFVRIHRSHLVAIDRIARIEPYAKDSRIAVLRDGREIPVSRSGYARLRELMGG